ncbi:unnamed protein product, partial [Ilex paraguariensis]
NSISPKILNFSLIFSNLLNFLVMARTRVMSMEVVDAVESVWRLFLVALGLGALLMLMAPTKSTSPGASPLLLAPHPRRGPVSILAPKIRQSGGQRQDTTPTSNVSRKRA